MKSLKDFLTEAKEEKTVVIPEKEFLKKFGKGHKIETPHRNPCIKYVDGNMDIRYNVVPTGASAWISEVNDTDKRWYAYSPRTYEFIKDVTVYEIKTYKVGESTALLADTFHFPTFELMSERETKKFRTNPDPNANELGMILCNGNIGSFAQMFTDKNIKEVEKRLKKMGFEIKYE
jgi:hypothetical protein